MMAYNRLIVWKDASRTIGEEAQILRFQCVQCDATCGALPEFICPRRWYLWCMQQIVITELLQAVVIHVILVLIFRDIWLVKQHDSSKLG